MTIKIKTTLLTIFFLFGLLTGLHAQDKYEFATLVWSPNSSRLSISINGKDFTEEKVELSKDQFSLANSNPLLTELNKFQDKGWEVVSISPAAFNVISHYAYLRKRKP